MFAEYIRVSPALAHLLTYSQNFINILISINIMEYISIWSVSKLYSIQIWSLLVCIWSISWKI